MTPAYLTARQTALSFWNRYRDLDRDDLISEAYLAAARVEGLYRPDRGPSLSGWVAGCVWRHLIGYRRKEYTRNRYLPRADADPALLPVRLRWRLPEFLEELSSDAAEAVELALTLPWPRNGKPGLGKLRRALSEAGWHGRQIAQAFSELREALS